MRSLSAVELALVVSVSGIVLAASAPTFFRDLHASRLSEAVDGVSLIAKHASAYSQGKELSASYPPPAGLTPAQVPRGQRVTDPPGTWNTATWQSLDFHIDGPHWFSFAFDVSSDPSRIWFQARAHGDLNGDGIFSTFEVVGERRAGQSTVILPELRAHREVE